MHKPASARLQAPDLRTADSKRRYNSRLFSVVAPRYGCATQVLSLGRDARWKHALVDMLPQNSARRICDIACGTGDISHLLRRRFPQAHIVGVDLSADMMARTAPPDRNGRMALCRGDMDALPFPDCSVDIITGGYALRNAPHVDTAVAEIARVLKSGAVAAFLEFSRTDNPVTATICHYLLFGWGALCGIALHGDYNVYAYIARSLRTFPRRTRLHALLADNGLQISRRKRFFGGIIEITLCQRRR